MLYRNIDYILLNENCIFSRFIVNFLIKNSTDLKRYIQPIGYKLSWQNCAKIIIGKGYPKNKDVISDMFKWLQDLNWPGAQLFFEYIPKLPQDVFWTHFKNSLNEAEKNSDYDWLWSLNNLVKLNGIKPLSERDMKLIAELDKKMNDY